VVRPGERQCERKGLRMTGWGNFSSLANFEKSARGKDQTTTGEGRAYTAAKMPRFRPMDGRGQATSGGGKTGKIVGVTIRSH